MRYETEFRTHSPPFRTCAHFGIDNYICTRASAVIVRAVHSREQWKGRARRSPPTHRRTDDGFDPFVQAAAPPPPTESQRAREDVVECESNARVRVCVGAR